MFPIPIDLLKTADIGIAMANSVDVMTMANIPTINIDINDFKPIGYYGITTTNKFERGISDKKQSLEKLLEFGLFSKDKLIIDHSSIDESNDIETIFQRQLEFISLNNINEYFDIQKRFPVRKYIRYRLSKLLHNYILKDITY